eukprot:m.109272 g.109272  ORF g.109272 m.109272 type:complete len:72 (+) comp9295_c1_seq1:144-359(+)
MARWLRPHLVHLGTAAFALFVIYSLATLCALSFDSRLGLDDGLDDFEIPGGTFAAPQRRARQPAALKRPTR